MKRKNPPPPPEPREPLLDKHEAADYLGVSEWTLKNWVQLKKVPHVRIGRQVVRFNRRALDRFIASNSETSER